MREGPVWDSTIGEGDRLALGESSTELDRTPDVLVVGGGVIGLATAAMCVRAGLGRVQVIEAASRLATGPSGSAAGGLSPGVHALARSGAFIDLASEGLALHRELDAEWDVGLRTTDWLIASPAALEAGIVPAPAEILDGDEARSIVSELGEVGGAIAVRAQAWVNPLRLVAALARRAGSIATGVAMTEMVVEGERVARVGTTSGTMAPGTIVLATGSAPAQRLGPTPRWSPTKGHLLVTAPVPFRLSCAVGGLILVVQLEDGRLLAGGTFERDDSEPAIRPDIVAWIVSELERLLPATRGVEVEHAWCCFRPGTPDELPVIDRVPEVSNGFISTGHYRTGLLLAPAAGRAVASWIETGREPAGLEPFRADRFA